MSDCRWCDKSLPGDSIPACGNCILRTREEALGASEFDEEVLDKLDANVDLSEIAKPAEPKFQKGKTLGEIRQNLRTKTIFEQETPLSKEMSMKMVKIKSNSIRSRQFVVDNLVLAFDENGIAECRESDLPVIAAYSRVRPGRLAVVEEPKKAAPAPAPAPKKVEPKVEVPKEVVVPKPKTKTESKKVVSKKASFKKDSE